MTWTLLADSGCIDGNCPTLYVNPETGDVKVRGYQPGKPHTREHEHDVVIPAARWAALMASMPNGGQ